MLLIPLIAFFIIGWRVGARGKQFEAKHGVGLAVVGAIYSVASVDANFKQLRMAGLDASHVHSVENFAYAFGYGVLWCGCLLLLAGWLGNRRRIKKAMRKATSNEL